MTFMEVNPEPIGKLLEVLQLSIMLVLNSASVPDIRHSVTIKGSFVPVSVGLFSAVNIYTYCNLLLA